MWKPNQTHFIKICTVMVFCQHFEIACYFLLLQRILNFNFLTYSLVVVVYKNIYHKLMWFCRFRNFCSGSSGCSGCFWFYKLKILLFIQLLNFNFNTCTIFCFVLLHLVQFCFEAYIYIDYILTRTNFLNTTPTAVHKINKVISILFLPFFYSLTSSSFNSPSFLVQSGQSIHCCFILFLLGLRHHCK